MNKIVYLFGAGASRNALPIVKEIPDKIRELIKLLESSDYQISSDEKFDDLPDTKHHYQKQLTNDLKWLLKESLNYSSVDTFAKKLTITRKNADLNRLKVTLSIFFVFLQTLNESDKRYDTFYASILNNFRGFPKNLRILSWNYDYQFEISYLEYSDRSEALENQDDLNVKQKFDNRSNNRIFNNEANDKFGIYKLNGTTGFSTGRSSSIYHYIGNFNNDITLQFIEQIVKKYATYYNNDHTLSFAWEEDYGKPKIIDLAVQDTKDAVALVAIGYSFPSFNRDIDRKIINSMSKLKSVYFQAPDADILIERFKAIKDNVNGINLIPKYDTNQFVLPNEM